jgi:hypothetical protein
MLTSEQFRNRQQQAEVQEKPMTPEQEISNQIRAATAHLTNLIEQAKALQLNPQFKIVGLFPEPQIGSFTHIEYEHSTLTIKYS